MPIDTIEEKQKKIEFKSYCKKKPLEKWLQKNSGVSQFRRMYVNEVH